MHGLLFFVFFFSFFFGVGGKYLRKSASKKKFEYKIPNYKKKGKDERILKRENARIVSKTQKEKIGRDERIMSVILG